MKCSKCGKEMRKGYLFCSKDGAFSFANEVPAVFLPCEKHLLKDWNNLCSFYYMRHVYVTVPTGTDVSQLVKKQKLLNNSVGPKRIKSKYYLDGHMVGYGMQYEKEILSDFLLNASF